MHAVFSSPRLVPTKVRGLVDFLQQRFYGEGWGSDAAASG
jgi:hypothetical protein